MCEKRCVNAHSHKRKRKEERERWGKKGKKGEGEGGESVGREREREREVIDMKVISSFPFFFFHSISSACLKLFSVGVCEILIETIPQSKS